MIVFALWHSYELEDDDGVHDEDKFIGIFSSREKAEETVEALKDKEGFRDHPLDSFTIDEMTVDSPDWTDGFVTVRWRE